MAPAQPVWEKHSDSLEGRIVSVPEDRTDARRSLLDAGGKRYVLSTPRDVDVSFGDVVRVGGESGPLSEASGYQHGAVGTLRAIGDVEVRSAGPFVGRWGLAVRDSFRRFIDRVLSPKDAALVDAVAFNVTTDIDEADYSAMRRSGIVHVISTSGVHVVLVASLLAMFARRVPVPRPWSLAALAVLLVVYACAAGLRPPMVRSVGMALLALSAYLFRREPDGLSSMAGVSVVTLLADPWAVVDVGFWLSVVSVGGMVLFIDNFQPRERARGPKDWLSSALRTSGVASLATLPVVGAVFGQLALASPLANIVAVPASELLLVASLASWLLSLLVPVLGQGLLLISSGPLLGLLRGAAYAGAAFCPGVPSFSPYWCVWLYGVALAFWRPFTRPA